jgi:hypothetical protein
MIFDKSLHAFRSSPSLRDARAHEKEFAFALVPMEEAEAGGGTGACDAGSRHPAGRTGSTTTTDNSI